MINLTLFAQVNGWEDELTVKVKGDVMTISGGEVDLSVIPEGYRLPAEDIEYKWFTPNTFVYRENGELFVTLTLPVKFDSSDEMKSPKPIKIVKNGVVDIPKDKTVEEIVIPVIDNFEREPEALYLED